MVCIDNNFQGLKDFPKGLRVLLLDHDPGSAAELKARLEAMDYVVTIFCDENEALSAITNKLETFHVAIIGVEATSGNSDGSFKFLETARDLPTIMISDVDCLSTTMRCIALGAVEFLHKPIREDKLKNIWQHVVHKRKYSEFMKLEQAFNAGVGLVSESLKPVKESLVSILQLGQDNGEVGKDESDTEHVSVHEPSTPQLKCGTPFMDGNCLQEKANFSTQKQSRDQYAESKSVETTFDDSTAETLPGEKSDLQSVEGGLIKVKDNSGDNNSKIESSMSPLVQAKNDSHDCADNTVRFSGTQNSTRKTNKKKIKIDWTPDLHKKFVQAVEQLGAGQVIPSRILELMKVEGLTRHNVASHLQKYRMNRRHILSKEDERRCPQNKDAALKNYYAHRPIMAFMPYHSHHISYPVWGLQGNHQHPMQYWSPPLQPAENWQWKSYPALHADAWGCPVVPAFQGMGFPFPQDGSGYHSAGVVDNASEQSSFRLHPILNFKTVMQAEEVVDRVVKEAISKPWLPLPLGLKSPPTDGVLAELSRQGIIPCIPHHHGDLELDPH